jgi:hypothetical protein
MTSWIYQNMEWQNSTIFWRSDEALIHIGYEDIAPNLDN